MREKFYFMCGCYKKEKKKKIKMREWKVLKILSVFHEKKFPLTLLQYFKWWLELDERLFSISIFHIKNLLIAFSLAFHFLSLFFLMKRTHICMLLLLWSWQQQRQKMSFIFKKPLSLSLSVVIYQKIIPSFFFSF